MQFAALLAKKPAEASNPGPINAYIWNPWAFGMLLDKSYGCIQNQLARRAKHASRERRAAARSRSVRSGLSATVASFDYARRRLRVMERSGFHAPCSAQDASITDFEYTRLKTPFSAEMLASQADHSFWTTAERARRELGWPHRPMEAAFREVLDYEQAQAKR